MKDSHFALGFRRLLGRSGSESAADRFPGSTRRSMERLLALGLLAVLLLGGTATVWSRKHGERRARENLLQRTRFGACGIEPARILRLSGTPADEDSPDYQALKAKLTRMQKAANDSRFVYVCLLREGRPVFLADSEPPGSPDESLPGDPFDEGTPEFLRVLTEGRETTEGPVTDSWGTWVSGLCPILDPETGRVLALFGMDIDARRWELTLAAYESGPIVGSLLLAALLILFHLAQLRVEASARRLRISHESLGSIVENSPIATQTFDLSGRVLTWNPAATALYGWTAGEAVGRTLDHLMLDEKGAEEFRLLLEEIVRTNGSPEPTEWEFSGKDGRRGAIVSRIFMIPGAAPEFVCMDLDVTVQKRDQEVIRRLARAIEATADAVVVTDAEGRIQSVNPAFTAITGYSEEEALGQTPRVLKSGAQPAEAYEEMWCAITAGRVWTGEVVNRRKDGSLYHASLTISPITESNGKVSGFVGTQRDVSAQRQAVTELAAAREEAERANRELRDTNVRLEDALVRSRSLALAAEEASRSKSAFLANMSHEIRTPMNAVIGMTGLLLDTPLNQEQREFAEVIRGSGESLLALINDILDYSKIEAGKLDLETLEFDLRVLLEDVADTVALKAHEKGLECVCAIEPEVPALLLGDPGRIRQVLINLAGNAVKFTHRGEIVIRARLVEESEDRARVRFEVADSGIGIPKDKQDALFQAFTQVDSSTTRRFGGTGLGLSISRQLTELMGGTIGLASVEGNGSTFWFELLLSRQKDKAEPKTANLADLAGQRIMVAEHNHASRLFLSTILARWGCEVVEARDVESALEGLHESARCGRPVAAVLLNQNLAGFDGEEAGKRIKADPAIASASLILLSSFGRRGDADRVHRAGFAGYLPKPVRQGALRDCLATVLGYADAAVKPAEAPLVTRHSLAEAARRKRILVAEDNAVNQKVVLRILEKLGVRAEAVANGREVIQSLSTIPYDLVLMDCQMPEMDGYEATAVVRSLASPVLDHAIPIIALTAHALKGDREKCLQAGMNDHIPKPISPRSLAETLEKWLRAETDQAA